MVKKEKICLLKIPIKLQIIHSIHVKAQTRVKKYRLYTVPNPELEISGGGEGGFVSDSSLGSVTGTGIRNSTLSDFQKIRSSWHSIL